MKPLSEFTEQELKAAAYERILAINGHKSALRIIEDELRRRAELQNPAPETAALAG